MKPFTILMLFGLLLWQTGCRKSDHGHDHGDHAEHAGHDHDDHDDHDGHDHGDEGHAHAPGLLEVGEHIAHIDFHHDDDAGSVTLTFTGPDAKTPLKITAAPKLNLTGDNPTQLVTKAVGADGSGASAVFSVTDPVLKGEPEGRIVVTVGGETYQVMIEHDHDHAGHDH